MTPPQAPDGSVLTPRRERWLLITLAGIQFTHIMDFMIMMPLGPQFTALFGISDAKFGLLVSAYTLAAGASGLLASTYIDRFDRKRLLLVLYVLFALATLACGLAPSYSALMVARIAAGAFGGVLSALSQTIVADVIPFERRGRAAAVVMSSFSVSTVAGVPLGLFLAAHFNWHAPFFLIAALCALLAVGAAMTLPAMRHHLEAAQPHTVWHGIRDTLAEANHLRAFVFSALLMMSSFTVIPYITIYYQANLGLRADQIPVLYLAGGAATLVTARLFGRMTDARGKVPTFTLVALAAVLPMFALTLLPPSPFWVVMIVSTTLFIFFSGRMIPGMAIVSSTALPTRRGTFMTLNASVQSAAMGVAAFVGGQLISRDAAGHVTGYWLCAVVGLVATVAAIALARRLVLHGAVIPAPQNA